MQGQAPKRTKPKRAIVDALVLAFSRSPLVKVLGTDSLRLVLDIQYRELLQKDEFRLDKLWTLLEEQPGFVPEQAVPPLCRFKTWEKSLGLTTRMPPHLASLALGEIAQHAKACPVTNAEFAVAMEASKGRSDGATVPLSGARTPAPPTRVASGSGKGKGKRSAARASTLVVAPANFVPRGSQSNVPFGSIAKLVAAGSAIAVLVAALFLIHHEPSVPVDHVLLSNVPVSAMSSSGEETSIKLADDSWLERSEEQRVQDVIGVVEEMKLARTGPVVVVGTDGNVEMRAAWTQVVPGAEPELIIEP